MSVHNIVHTNVLQIIIHAHLSHVSEQSVILCFFIIPVSAEYFTIPLGIIIHNTGGRNVRAWAAGTLETLQRRHGVSIPHSIYALNLYYT